MKNLELSINDLGLDSQEFLITTNDRILESYHDSINTFYQTSLGKIEALIVNHLLQHTDNLDNYELHLTGLTSQSGYFILDGEKVLRYSYKMESENSAVRDLRVVDDILYNFKYEVYSYVDNEYLYIEED